MSTLKVTNINSLTATTPPVINDSAGTQIGTFCRSWVNFNGTGTVAIRASFNVASITDNGTGDYTVNFTTAMADANFNAISTASDDVAGGSSSRIISNVRTQATGSVRISCQGVSASTYIDTVYTSLAVFR